MAQKDLTKEQQGFNTGTKMRPAYQKRKRVTGRSSSYISIQMITGYSILNLK